MIGTLLITIFMLAKLGVFSALLLFWMVGLVPGTDYTLSPLLTFSCTALLLIIVSLYHVRLTAFLKKQLRFSNGSWQRHLPQRRYSQIRALIQN